MNDEWAEEEDVHAITAGTGDKEQPPSGGSSAENSPIPASSTTPRGSTPFPLGVGAAGGVDLGAAIVNMFVPPMTEDVPHSASASANANVVVRPPLNRAGQLVCVSCSVFRLPPFSLPHLLLFAGSVRSLRFDPSIGTARSGMPESDIADVDEVQC